MESPLNREKLARLAAALNLDRSRAGGLAVGQMYHELPFDDLDLSCWRKDVRQRAGIIQAFSRVDGKKGIDLGCSVGGITFALQMMGARMTGVDHSAEDIGLALCVEAEYRTGAEFRIAEVDRVIWEEMRPGGFDFAVWLSQWMWYVRQAGKIRAHQALRRVSECVEHLWFEVSVGDGHAGDTMLELGIRSSAEVAALLREWTRYGAIRIFEEDESGAPLKRPLLLCSR